MNHEFRSVPRIVCAAGALQQVGQVFAGLGARRVLLVCDPGIVRLGFAGKARAALLAQVGQRRIEGGLMPVDGYVSWVEELVWHATPVLGHRESYTLEQVVGVLNAAAYTGDTADVLVQIAETPGGRFAHWLSEQGADANALSEPFMRDLWRQLRADPKGAETLQRLREDARAIDWNQRKLGTASVVIETCSPETQAFELVRQSTGMATRPRSNSDNLQPLLAQKARNQPRDFFRICVLLQALK